MVPMPKDQVEIKFGPTRYDSPKAVRRAIEEASTETEENTINNLINNPDISLGGGAAGVSGVIVDTYDPATGIGSGTDADGVSYQYTNGTGVFLVPGDEIFIMSDAQGAWIAVGVTERTGQVIPIDQPIPTLSTGFPLLTGSQVFPIRPDNNVSSGNVSNSVAYDLAGEFGLGADAIIGNNTSSSASSVNAFIRGSATNVSLFIPKNLTSAKYYVQPGGRLITVNSLNSNLGYRSPGDTAWTSFATTSARWAIDYETGIIWGATLATLSPGGVLPRFHTYYRFAPTDAAPVNMGRLGTGDSTVNSDEPYIAAGNGYLTTSVNTFGGTVRRRYYVKLTTDNSNFTDLGEFALASWNPSLDQIHRLQVDSSGSTTYLALVSGTLRVRKVDQSLIITDNDTGIPITTSYGYNHKHLSSGLIAIHCAVRQDYLGGVSTTQFSPVLATYNYSSTAYQYYDLALFGSATTVARFGGIVETVAGTIRFTVSDTTESASRVIELSGL